MAESCIDIRVNGVSLQYPPTEEEYWPEIVLEDLLDADMIDG